GQVAEIHDARAAAVGVDHRLEAGNRSIVADPADDVYAIHLRTCGDVFFDAGERIEFDACADQPGRRGELRVARGVAPLRVDDGVGIGFRHAGNGHEHLARRLVDVDPRRNLHVRLRLTGLFEVLEQLAQDGGGRVRGNHRAGVQLRGLALFAARYG